MKSLGVFSLGVVCVVAGLAAFDWRLALVVVGLGAVAVGLFVDFEGE